MHHRARLLLLILVASVEANLFSRWAPYLPPPSHGHSHHRSLRAPRGLVSEPDDVHPICKRSVTATQAGTNRSNWIFPPRLESSPLKLATPPHCGSLEGKSVVDSNMGIDISKIKTIVAFGDSYSSTGWDDGRDPTEAIVRPPSPFSGTQDPFYGGRFSNGWVWTEWLAKILPSKPKLRDFAVSGAVTNISYFPGLTDWYDRPVSDFPKQLGIYQKQSIADPASTLYTVYFGINDYNRDISQLPQSGLSMVRSLERLHQAPFNAKNILIVGLQYNQAEQYRQVLFGAAQSLRLKYRSNIAFLDAHYLYSAIANNPLSFGVTSLGNCVEGITITNMCTQMNTTFFWTLWHPSTYAHLLVAQYAEKVLTTCKR